MDSPVTNPPSPPSPAGSPSPPRQTAGTSRRWMTAAAATLAILAGGTLVFALSRDGEPTADRGGYWARLQLTVTSPAGDPLDAASLRTTQQILTSRIATAGLAESTVTVKDARTLVVRAAGGPDVGDRLRTLVRPATLRVREVLRSVGGQPSPAPTATPSAPTTERPAPASEADVLAKFPPAAVDLVARAGNQLTPAHGEADVAQLFVAAKDLTSAEVAALPTVWLLDVPYITCSMLRGRPPSALDDPARQVVACDGTSTTKYLLGPASLGGADVESVTATADKTAGDWRITIAFTDSGQQRWTALTRMALGKQVALVLDGDVVSAPAIESMTTGDAVISGNFAESEATTLAALLGHGALAADVSVDEIAVSEPN